MKPPMSLCTISYLYFFDKSDDGYILAETFSQLYFINKNVFGLNIL
jgi:hypothetical protein